MTNLSNLSHSKSSIVPFAKFRSDLKNTFLQCTCSQMFFKIGLRISFLIFTRKCLCWSLFLIMLHAWWPATLLKNRPLYRCFRENITKCLRVAFLWNISHSCFWKWLRNFQEFLIQLEQYLCRRIHKGERFVKMLCSRWRHKITNWSFCKHSYLCKNW